MQFWIWPRYKGYGNMVWERVWERSCPHPATYDQMKMSRGHIYIWGGTLRDSQGVWRPRCRVYMGRDPEGLFGTLALQLSGIWQRISGTGNCVKLQTFTPLGQSNPSCGNPILPRRFSAKWGATLGGNVWPVSEHFRPSGAKHFARISGRTSGAKHFASIYGRVYLYLALANVFWESASRQPPCRK